MSPLSNLTEEAERFAMTRNEEMQRMMRRYKLETGERELDMEKVVRWAVSNGWPLPEPTNPLDRLKKEWAAAAREETRVDRKTGRPYRVNHVYTVMQGSVQLHLWIDIDEAPRAPMFKSLQMRRRQIVGDAVQLTFDADHWNDINPSDDPIVMELDLGPDVEWEKNAMDEDEEDRAG
jgi:hypothetical protein